MGRVVRRVTTGQTTGSRVARALRHLEEVMPKMVERFALEKAVMRWGLRVSVVVALVAVVRPATAVAAEAPAPVAGGVALEEVVITATRTAKESFDAPAAVSVVGEEEIAARRLPRTVPDALAELPGVMVQKTSRGQGSPYLRGFTGFRTLVLIDGIRLNNAVFRDGPNQYLSIVDPLIVDRLEVVRGGGSVLYGSDAVGGTVNLLTRAYTPEAGRAVAPRLYGRYAAGEDAWVGRAEVGSSRLPLRGLAGVSWKEFGDVRGGRDLGVLEHTGYDEHDGDVRLDLDLAKAGEATLTLAHQQVAVEDAWRTHSTVFGRSWHGTEVGTNAVRSLDQDRRLTYLQYHGRDLAPGVDRLTVSLSWQAQQELETRVTASDERRRSGFDVGSLGLWFQGESDTEWGYWSYGASWYRDAVDSFEERFNPDGSLKSVRVQGNVADDSTYDLAGLFVQDDLALGERFDLILGGRYDLARADGGRFADPLTGAATSFTDQWDNLSGSARLLFVASDTVHLYTSLSQAFRAPNLSDLTSSIDARSGEQEIAATDLDPEQYLTAEAGVKVHRTRLAAEASVYTTRIDGMILRAPTGRLSLDGATEVTKLNSGDGFVHGVEVATRYRLTPAFTALADVSWVEGEVDTYAHTGVPKSREPLDRLAPATGHLGLRWEPEPSRGWLEGLVTVAAKADRLSSRDRADRQRIPPGGTPGYTVVTVRGGLSLRPDLTLTAVVENLLDEDYRIHGSGDNEPGTNVILALDWRP